MMTRFAASEPAATSFAERAKSNRVPPVRWHSQAEYDEALAHALAALLLAWDRENTDHDGRRAEDDHNEASR